MCSLLLPCSQQKNLVKIFPLFEVPHLITKYVYLLLHPTLLRLPLRIYSLLHAGPKTFKELKHHNLEYILKMTHQQHPGHYLNLYLYF